MDHCALKLHVESVGAYNLLSKKLNAGFPLVDKGNETPRVSIIARWLVEKQIEAYKLRLHVHVEGYNKRGASCYWYMIMKSSTLRLDC